MSATMNPLAYSPADAAKVIGISPRSLRYLIKKGHLGFARIGRRVLIPHSEIKRLLRRATVKATVPLDADEPIRPRGEKNNAPAACTPEALNGGAVRPAPFYKERINDTTPAT
jgi:excisionase family DNA binding protein